MENLKQIEELIQQEILRLNFRNIIIKKVCNKFGISNEEAKVLFFEVRFKMKKLAAKRAWTYLLIGSIFFGVGLFGTLSKTGFIFYGAILTGLGLLVTAFGLFRISLLKEYIQK